MPGGPAVGALLVLSVVLASDGWVYLDARSRADRGAPVAFSAGSLRVETPAAWLAGCLLVWVLFFPLYVTSRNR